MSKEMDVTLIIANDLQPTGLSKCEHNLSPLIAKNIPVKVIPLRKIRMPSRLVRGIYLLINLLGFNLKFNKNSQSIIHFMDQNLAFLLNFIPIKEKVVVSTYDIFPLMPDCWKRWNLIEKLRFWLVFEGVKKADKILTISQYMKNQIHNYLQIPLSKIEVFYEGANKGYIPMKCPRSILQRYSIPKNNKIILFVGSEITRKNFQTVIRAFKIINDNLPQTRLVKVGAPLWEEERKKIINLAEDLGLEDKIIFTGVVPESDLPKIYNLADVFITLTFDEGGAALPILEALACGKPVIISDIPALRETIKKAVFVDPEDYKTAAEEALKILRNPDLALRMGRSALERSKIFSWERAVSKIICAYRDILTPNEEILGAEISESKQKKI